MSIILSPKEVAQEISERARALRLAKNLSQQGLADRAGVSVSALRVFERTGKISLESLVKIAFVLEDIAAFQKLFSAQTEAASTLDELIAEKHTRKRGRLK